MKFYFFHLMPYQDIDPDFLEHNKSSWVTLPNTYYDPKKGNKLYHRYLDELEYCDQLGYDGICVNEHHQTAYSLMPVPGVTAGALARRTTNAKIALLGRALPLVNNPLTIAEEFAMLDNISGGRLVAGFVRGIGAEYHSSGVNPTESKGRFDEAHDLIIRAWTEPGPFRFSGKYYHFEHVNTWPRPYQQPRPPVWIPSQGSGETIEFASHPDRKYTYLQTFAPTEVLKKYVTMYRDTAEKYGYAASNDQIGWAAQTYVAETDEIAYREAKPHIESFLQKYMRMPKQMLLPPGYTSLRSMKFAMKARGTMIGDPQTIDDVLNSGMFVCGSPSTVRDKLKYFQKEIGFGTFLPTIQFATLPHDLTMKNIELFAKEVIPHLRDTTDTKAQAGA
jgi:alkanesulfonate monooxygenase SsuD/methylene tetrahydromethanopterin reductase-like flavin-dependent oxidoreductase (luciferase family)